MRGDRGGRILLIFHLQVDPSLRRRKSDIRSRPTKIRMTIRDSAVSGELVYPSESVLGCIPLRLQKDVQT
jgi:hypothetical protein